MPSSISLYQISQEGQFIQDCLIDSEGELTPEIEERIHALLIQGKDKLEAARVVALSLEQSCQSCKIESKRLMERARIFDDAITTLKSRMVSALDMAFGGRVETELATLWTQKAADSQSFELAEEVTLDQLQQERPDFVRTKLEINKQAIKSAYDRGEPMPDSIFVNKTTGQRYLRVK